MSWQLQQPDPGYQATSRKADVLYSEVSLKANTALLLVLVLIIIPTFNGVTLIT